MNLQIMIDGKPSVLTGEEETIFKNIDGANIKAVEIIANPSAKYDAAGSAGIFYRLKKISSNGFNRKSENIGRLC
jgi:hypothetical protein